MSDTTVLDIVRDWLKNHGYDGLWSEDDCGCEVDDLAPCGGQDMCRCHPGYRHSCTEACASEETGHEPYEYEPGDWHIGPKKPEVRDE